MAKTAIIVAPDERALQKVFGSAAVRRLALMTAQAGLSVHVIGHVRPLIPLLSDLIPEKAFYKIDNRSSLEELMKNITLSDDEGVLIIKAHHIINRLCLKKLLSAWNAPGTFVMKSHNGNINDGLFLISSHQLLPFISALLSPDKKALDFKKNSTIHFVEGIAGLPYVMGAGSDEIKVSESRLVSALAAQTEGEDGFLASHMDRPVSRFISKRLARTPVTPNMITLIGVTIGSLGAFLLAQPGYGYHVLGSLLFLICIIIDGVDGEVARLTLEESVFGHYLDVVTDNLVHLFLFIAMPLGLYRETGDYLYIHALWFMIGGFSLCLIAVYQYILRRSDDELSRTPKIVRFMSLMTNRDFAYLIVVLALIDQLKWFVLGAAAGTYVFAFTLWGVFFFERSAQKSLPD